jgi:YD repeat-containing protein
VTYGYDLANRVTEIIYPSGRYVTYTYDSSGYLTTVTTKPSAMGGTTTLASSIVHKPFGTIASFTYGNSEAQTRTYNNNYWLTDLDTVYSGAYVQRLDFGYDYAGNLTSITDNISGGRSETYTVDELNRLATASGDYGSRTYTYDDNSGRATKYDGSRRGPPRASAARTASTISTTAPTSGTLPGPRTATWRPTTARASAAGR